MLLLASLHATPPPCSGCPFLCCPCQAAADAVFSGVLLGYVAYDCMHYLMHRWAAMLTGMGSKLSPPLWLQLRRGRSPDNTCC